jgi:hypothetical protein
MTTRTALPLISVIIMLMGNPYRGSEACAAKTVASHALVIGGIRVADGHDGIVGAHGTDVEGWEKAVFEAGVEAVRNLLRVHVVFSLRRDLMVGQRLIHRVSRALQ